VHRSVVALSLALAVSSMGGLALAGTPKTADRAGTSRLSTLPSGERVHELLARVTAAQKSLRSLRAHFRQTKRGAMFLRPAVSTGAFTYLAPDLVRWDYEKPRRMVVVFARNVLTTYGVESGRVQRVKIPRRERRFVRLLSGTQPLDKLAENFRITLTDGGQGAPYLMRFEPEGPRLKHKLKHVIIAVDRKLFLPVRVEYVDGDGDSTLYEFSRLELNPEVKPGEFSLELGEDVRVETVRPGGSPSP